MVPAQQVLPNRIMPCYQNSYDDYKDPLIPTMLMPPHTIILVPTKVARTIWDNLLTVVFFQFYHSSRRSGGADFCVVKSPFLGFSFNFCGCGWTQICSQKLPSLILNIFISIHLVLEPPSPKVPNFHIWVDWDYHPICIYYLIGKTLYRSIYISIQLLWQYPFVVVKTPSFAKSWVSVCWTPYSFDPLSSLKSR